MLLSGGRHCTPLRTIGRTEALPYVAIEVGSLRVASFVKKENKEVVPVRRNCHARMSLAEATQSKEEPPSRGKCYMSSVVEEVMELSLHYTKN